MLVFGRLLKLQTHSTCISEKGVDTGLLVRLQQLEKLEADPHPLAGGDKLRAAVRNPAHDVDRVLLHLLVPVLQNWRQPRQEILDRRLHLGHPDHVDDDGLESAQNTAEHLGVFLPPNSRAG